MNTAQATILKEDLLEKSKTLLLDNKKRIINDTSKYGNIDMEWKSSLLEKHPRSMRKIINFFLSCFIDEIASQESYIEEFFDIKVIKEKIAHIFNLCIFDYFELKKLKKLLK